MDTNKWTINKGKNGLENRLVEKSLIKKLRSMGYSEKEIEYIFSKSSEAQNNSTTAYNSD